MKHAWLDNICTDASLQLSGIFLVMQPWAYFLFYDDYFDSVCNLPKM